MGMSISINRMDTLLLPCFAFLFSLLATEHSTPVKTHGSSVRPKTINLFNGKNLDGWYTFLQHRGRDSDPKKVFTVNDKVLRVSGEEWGCITTKEEFSNYKLVVEFKWGTQTFAPRADNARDNGILLN